MDAFMFEQLLDPAYGPFVIAGIIVLLIATLEVAAVLFGLALSDAIDNLLPGVDLEGGEQAGALSWLGFGKAPFLVVLIVILATFAVAGILIQFFSQKLLGFTLWPALAVLFALIITLPCSSWLSRVVARVIPATETSGIHRDELVGREGRITQGVATFERVAEAEVVGPKGLKHWIRVRAERGETLNPGDRLRIIERESKVVFVARALELEQHP